MLLSQDVTTLSKLPTGKTTKSDFTIVLAVTMGVLNDGFESSPNIPLPVAWAAAGWAELAQSLDTSTLLKTSTTVISSAAAATIAQVEDSFDSSEPMLTVVSNTLASVAAGTTSGTTGVAPRQHNSHTTKSHGWQTRTRLFGRHTRWHNSHH